MDPVDIIKTAFPLNHLCRFVALSCICPTILITCWGCRRAIIVTRNEIQEQSSHKHFLCSLVNTLLLIGSTTIFLHCVFILCGINPIQLPIHTFISALYVATNTVLPIILPTPSWGGGMNYYKEVAEYLLGGPISSSDIQQSTHHNQQQRQTQRHNINQQQHKIQKIHQCSTLGTFIGMCACAIFRVLDHGMQIQRYPMPIIIGATAGRVGGVFLAVLVGAASS